MRRLMELESRHGKHLDDTEPDADVKMARRKKEIEEARKAKARAKVRWTRRVTIAVRLWAAKNLKRRKGKHNGGSDSDRAAADGTVTGGVPFSGQPNRRSTTGFTGGAPVGAAPPVAVPGDSDVSQSANAAGLGAGSSARVSVAGSQGSRTSSSLGGVQAGRKSAAGNSDGGATASGTGPRGSVSSVSISAIGSTGTRRSTATMASSRMPRWSIQLPMMGDDNARHSVLDTIAVAPRIDEDEDEGGDVQVAGRITRPRRASRASRASDDDGVEMEDTHALDDSDADSARVGLPQRRAGAGGMGSGDC